MAGFNRKPPPADSLVSRTIQYKAESLCLCGSSQPYGSCCKPYHDGVIPSTAEKTLRARYSAYALGVPEFIIQSSHPQSEDYVEYMVEAQASSKSSEKRWAKDIIRMSRDYKFLGFNVTEIREMNDKDQSKANISFIVVLSEKDGGIEAVRERCSFVYEGDRWLYVDGDVDEPPEDLVASMKTTWSQRQELTEHYGMIGERQVPPSSSKASAQDASKPRAETVRASGGLGMGSRISGFRKGRA